MPRVRWHYRAHQAWGNEGLVFWFLRFNSLYDQDNVLTGIEAALKEEDVCAYACYELMGLYDIFLRVWLPHGRRNEFAGILRRHLEPALRELEFFEVEEVVRQWIWASGPDETGPPAPPDPDFLNASPTPGQIAHLNDIEHLGDEALDDPLFRLYVDKNLVAAQPGTVGIKLITAIQPDPDLSDTALTRLGAHLGETLDELSGLAGERSVYYGRGKSTRFLLFCRIAYADFHRFRTEVLTKISKLIRLVGDIRTLTFPVASPEFLLFRDQLPYETRTSVSVEALLEQDESQTVEVKATAFAPLIPWFRGEVERPSEPPAYPNNTILRAIGSFLNTNEGIVVVGALEERDYKEGQELLGELPQVGAYWICGVLDPTFLDEGWNQFQLKLKQLVDERIDGPTAGLLEFDKATVRGKDVCVIRVESPRAHEGFFVRGEGQDHFFIRDGNGSKRLNGRETLEYLKRRRERVRLG